MKRTGSKSTPAKAPMSPAARVLTNRALNRSSPWKSPKQSLAAPQEQSDSDNSTYSHEKLVEMLGRQSWKQNLRESVVNPTFEPGRESNERLSSGIKQKSKRTSTHNLSTNRIFLTNADLSEEEESNDDPRIADVSGRRSSNESFGAFKPSGPVRHSESEDSEIEIRRTKLQRSPRKVGDKRLEALLPAPPVMKTKHIQEEVDSGPESPIKIRRKRKNSTLGNQTRQIDLQLNATEYSVHRIANSESSEVDSPDLKLQKRKKFKKSMKADQNKYFDLSPLRTSEPRKSNIPSNNDTDSDVDIPLTRRTRAKKSTRGTEIENLNLVLSPSYSERDASIVESSEGEQVRRKTKKTREVKKSGLKISLPSPDKENQVAPDDDSETDLSHDDVRKRRSQRTKDKANTEIQLPQMTPEKSFAPEKVASDVDESPLPVQRRLTRSFKENLGTSQPIILSPATQSDSLNRIGILSDQESPVRVTRSRATLHNSTLIEMPVLEESYKEHDDEEESSIDEPLKRKSRRSQRKSPRILVDLQSLNSPDKVNQHLHTEIHSSDDEVPSIQHRQTKSKNSKGQPSATNLSPAHNISENQALSSDESEDIAPKKRALSRKSTGVNVMNLSPLGSPAKQSATKETDQNPEDNDGEPVERKSRQNQRKSSSALVDLPSFNSLEMANQRVKIVIQSPNDAGPSIQHRQTRSKTPKGQPAATNLSPAHNNSGDQASSSDESEDIAPKKRAVLRKSSGVNVMNLSPLGSPAKQSATKETDQSPEDNDGEPVERTSRQNQRKSPSALVDLPALKSPEKVKQYLISQIHSPDEDGPTNIHRQKSAKSTKEQAATINLSPARNTIRSSSSSDESEEIASRKRVIARKSSRATSMKLSPLKSSPNISEADKNKVTEHPPDKATDKLSKSREQIETLVLDENLSEDADSEEEAIVEKQAEVRKSNKEMTLDLPTLKEAPSKKTPLAISKRKSIWSASKEKPTQSNMASSKNLPRKSHAAVPQSHTVTSQDKDAHQPSDESEEEVIVSRKKPAARVSNNEMTFELSPLASTTLNSRVNLSSKSLSESDHSAVSKPKTFSLKKTSVVSETSGGELQRSRIPIEGRPGYPHYQSGPVETAQEKAQHSLQKKTPDTHVDVGKESSETHEHNNNSDELDEEIDLSSLERSKESKVMRLSSSLLKNSQIETGTRSQHTFKMGNADQVNTSRYPVAATGSEQALSDIDFDHDWEEDHSDLNKNISISTLSKNHNIGIGSEKESFIDETAGTRATSRAIELDKSSGVERQDQGENVEHDMHEESATLSDEPSINAKRTNLRQKTPNRSTPFKKFTLFSPEKSQNVANDSSDGEEIQPKRQLRKKSESNSVGQTTHRQAEPTHGTDGSSGSSKSDKVRIMENNSERLGKTSGNVESTRQTRKLSLFASKQRAQSSRLIAETDGEDATKVKRKDTSNLHESSTMELDYSILEEESDTHSTSKRSNKDAISMFLASDKDESNESHNSANVASTETAAQQNAPNNTDSDTENDETPVVFKRRKILYKKSNDQPELSLKLSFQSSGIGGKSAEQVGMPKPPDVTSLNSGKTSSSKEKEVSEQTSSRDEISLTDERMQRHTMFQYTGDSNVNDILLSAKRVSALSIDPRRSGKTSQQKGESASSATNANQKTGIIRKSQFSQETAKRNLQKHLEQAEEEFSQSHEQPGKETEEPRTSTPVGDVSLTVEDVTDAVDLMETNGEQNKNSSEARLYTAEDFKTAISRFVRPQQSTKSKKIFSLADLERAMVAVRSPSMMIDSSKRDSIQGGKNLFSLQDFERALMKLKNKSVLGARYSLMGMNEISNITLAQSAAASNPAQRPQISETANSAVEEQAESRTIVFDTPEQFEDKGENQTVYATPSDPGSDSNDDQKTESESQHTEEESESEHTEVQDSDENTARTIETSPSVNADNNSDGPSINDGNLDVSVAQEETQTQENEPDESMLPGPSGADEINGDSSEEEIVAAKQSSQKKSGNSSGAPLPLHQRIQSIGKHQSLITSFLSQASASTRTSVRRSILQSGEISPPPWQHMLGDPNESGVASMKDRELKRTLFLKEHQERKKRIEAKLATKEKEFSTVKKRVPPSKPTGITKKKTASKNPTRTNTGFTQPDILKELKRDQWVNKRLLNKLDKYFKNGPPRVRNDFLRTLSVNINSVLRQKKVNEANVRKVMRACHKAGVAKDFNEFARFMREYLPTSFETKAFTDKLFREEYYFFE
ncbi:uncharacterized protein LOC135942588 isoform X2 [Cloeon dipterum]|uniref:uncharacterized protein LOC135942588 isoform X2 n=1 Tax=Cloeon dipterum TaxID=197152 RepID=UPI00321FB554